MGFNVKLALLSCCLLPEACVGCYLLKGTASTSTWRGYPRGPGFAGCCESLCFQGLGVSAERCFPLLSEPGCAPVSSLIAQSHSSPLEKSWPRSVLVFSLSHGRKQGTRHGLAGNTRLCQLFPSGELELPPLTTCPHPSAHPQVISFHHHCTAAFDHESQLFSSPQSRVFCAESSSRLCPAEWVRAEGPSKPLSSLQAPRMPFASPLAAGRARIPMRHACFFPAPVLRAAEGSRQELWDLKPFLLPAGIDSWPLSQNHRITAW